MTKWVFGVLAAGLLSSVFCDSVMAGQRNLPAIWAIASGKNKSALAMTSAIKTQTGRECHDPFDYSEDFFSFLTSYTSRPLKCPQFGQTTCGRRLFPQLEQVTRFVAINASCERRRSRRPFECLRFGWGVMKRSPFIHASDGRMPVWSGFYEAR